MKNLFVRFTAAAILFAGVLSFAAPATAAEAPDVYMQNLLKEISNGNGAAIWNALPKDYQGDIEDLVEDFAKNMDADIWDGAFKVVGKLAKVMKDKKEYIFASDFTKAVPPPQLDEAKKNWDSIVDALHTVATSDVSTIEGLKDLDAGEFIEKTGNKIVGGLMKASENTPQAAEGLKKLKAAKVTLVSKEGDDAVLKFETDGEEPKEEKYTLVDGKWLPAKMVDDWDDSIEKAKASVAGLKIPAEQKVQIMQFVGIANTLLDSLQAAKSQEEFDAALKSIQGLIPGAAGPPRE